MNTKTQSWILRLREWHLSQLPTLRFVISFFYVSPRCTCIWYHDCQGSCVLPFGNGKARGDDVTTDRRLYEHNTQVDDKIFTEFTGLVCAKLVSFLLYNNYGSLIPAIDEDASNNKGIEQKCLGSGKRGPSLREPDSPKHGTLFALWIFPTPLKESCWLSITRRIRPWLTNIEVFWRKVAALGFEARAYK